MDLPMIFLKEDREEFLVNPAIWPELTSEVIAVTLFTCVNRQGVVFLWPVKLPTPDGRRSEWINSSREAAETAMKAWTKMQSNMGLGAYEVTVSDRIVAEPVWPEETFDALVQIAFRGRIINDLDHHVVARLQGKA
jgi:uncharacterized protein YbdZ (MbtH family)